MGVLLFRGLQPMLVDIGFQLVTGRTQIATPQFPLFEAHLVEDARRQSGLVIGKELRVAKPTVPHHGTLSFAALRPAFSCLLRTSARRALISSRVSTFCSTSRLRMARIHFS